MDKNWVVWVGLEDYFFETKEEAEDFARLQKDCPERLEVHDVLVEDLKSWYETQKERLARWH
jgi:hypothetical protein